RCAAVVERGPGGRAAALLPGPHPRWLDRRSGGGAGPGPMEGRANDSAEHGGPRQRPVARSHYAPDGLAAHAAEAPTVGAGGRRPSTHANVAISEPAKTSFSRP